MGCTELILSDCFTVWEQWDEKTEIGRNADGLLVAVRLNGLIAQKEPKDGR